MKGHPKDQNLDQKVIDGFGQEWSSFGYSATQSKEALDAQFSAYCSPIDLSIFDKSTAIAGDFGAGSGRWSLRLLASFSKVYALEPSDGAFEVLKHKFETESRVMLLKETVGQNSIADSSLDLGMSLGVLHHIPDTGLALRDVSKKIKPGGYFLCYLYYNLEGKPLYYRFIFQVADIARRLISPLPYPLKALVSRIIAAVVYWPLARLSKKLNKLGINTSNFPLHHYAEMPFMMLANDALDRFGTNLEQRFNKSEIIEMLRKADFDLSTLNFSEKEPFWTFSVQKKI
jgi:SAM-dependent methyltransferase